MLINGDLAHFNNLIKKQSIYDLKKDENMIFKTTSQKIGYKQSFKAITIGLAVAYIILALIGGHLWIFKFNYAPTIIFAAILSYLAGYFWGALIGKWIIDNKKSPLLLGILGGFLIMWTATLGGSLVGFYNEGFLIKSALKESLYDYVIKPLFVVTFYGFIPIVLVGIWFGRSIYRIGNTSKKNA